MGDEQQDSTDRARWSIKHGSRIGGTGKCGATGEWLTDTPKGWVGAIGTAAVCEDGLDQMPPDLRTMLDDLRDSPPIPGENDFAIVSVEAPAYQTTACAADFMTGGTVHRAPGVGWGVSNANGVPRLLGPAAAWRLCPSLAAVLHAHDQLPARPAPKPAPAPPPPPPPPTQGQLRAGAVAKVATLLGRTNQHALGLLQAIEIYLESK